jgi:hypothetical protein
MADFYFKYSSDFRQILHYFTVFNQCFNERHFLMEISVNRIIIAGLSDQRRGEGGGGDWIAFFSALRFKPQIMTQPPVCMYLWLKVLKFEKILTRIYNWKNCSGPNDVEVKTIWPCVVSQPRPPPSPPPATWSFCLQFLGIDRPRVPCLILFLG